MAEEQDDSDAGNASDVADTPEQAGHARWESYDIDGSQCSHDKLDGHHSPAAGRKEQQGDVQWFFRDEEEGEGCSADENDKWDHRSEDSADQCERWQR